jgi:tRNA (adenine37-N6)-methyltransferase
MQAWTVRPIGFVRSPFSEPHQVPRGLGAKHEETGILEILPEFEAGLKDVEGFSHLFVLWIFDRNRGYELVGTPPSDTQPHGVFASRSPRRPNPIGLTVVRLTRREGAQLHVLGVDMVEGTPILDIKPYLSAIPESELRRGWLAAAEARRETQGRLSSDSA